MVRFTLLTPTLACALLLALPLLAIAQASPTAATPPAGVITPDPADCDVEPLPMSVFEQFAATPPAMPPDAHMRFSKPGDTPRPWTMPAGEPADAATVEAVTAVLHEALACLNAGDFRRFSALFSDDMLVILAATDPIPPDALPYFEASPAPSPPELWLGYGAVHDARVLPDGRVAALGEDWDPTEPPYGLGTDFAIFIHVGDRWLIDSLIENVVIVGEATPVAGTPVA